MIDQKIAIESLAMDLKRVAIGLHRGSTTMANRFKEEAIKRQSELEAQTLTPYLQSLILKSKQVLLSNQDRTAEDALMYSVLFQNISQKYTL